MKDFDSTTESGLDISLDEILGEFHDAGQKTDADALYSYLSADAEVPADEPLPELESENYQSSDFSYSSSFTNGVNLDEYDLPDMPDDEDSDVAVYIPAKERKAAAAPEQDEDSLLDEAQVEPAEEKKSSRGASADEARRYIAGLQGLFGRSRRTKTRRPLEELQAELDGETFSSPDSAEEHEPDETVSAAASVPEEFEFDDIYSDIIKAPDFSAPSQSISDNAENFASDENSAATDADSTVKKSEYSVGNDVEIDGRFNLGGHRKNKGILYGDREIDVSADEDYTQQPQRTASLSHWIKGEENQVIDEGVTGKRKIGRRKKKQAEREEMLRIQKEAEEAHESEEAAAEEFDDADAAPAEYAPYDGEDIPENIHFNVDEDAFPPTFRAYLSSILASVVLRLRGTNKRPTNNTMVDTGEDLGAEVSPAAAYKYYGSFIPFQRMRLRIALVMLLLLGYISAGFPVPGMLNNYKVAAAAALALELTVMLLSLDVFTNAITKIFRLKFGADSLAAVSCLITVLDAVMVAADVTAPHMPLCVLSALSMYGVSLASAYSTHALRKATRVPAISRLSFAVTSEEKLKDRQLMLLKSRRSVKGFVRRAEEMPPDENIFGKISVIILALALVFSLIVAAVCRSFSDFVYIFSVLLASAVPCTALLAFALPFDLGTKHLFPRGAAIAGWSGLCDIGTCRSIIVSDSDLFPDKSITVTKVDSVRPEQKARNIAYAGSLICASGSCISVCFGELMRSNGCTMQKVSKLEFASGGGINGLIDGHTVYCGSTDYMRLMNVRIPYTITSRTSVLLAIDGQLQCVFDIQYTPLPQVRQALVELMRSSRHPIFAIRDFNVTPDMLSKLFDLATDGYDFPPYAERFSLSEPSPVRAGSGKIAAVICTEGLTPLTAAAAVGRRMYLAARINIVITLIASLAGLFVPFIKLLTAGSVTVLFLMALMLIWVIPVVLVSLYVKK